VTSALTARGDLLAAREEVHAAEARLSLSRRDRVPNPTLSLFAQRDGFAEQVLGLGISLPLPTWHTGAGEVQEATARVAQAETDVESARRRVRLDVARALADFTRWRRASEQLSPALVQRAQQHLAAISSELRSGQLSVREALLNQRGLIEFLASALDVRLSLRLSRLELLRAAALPLPGVSR
jgi:cobalt-zinc-cadmium efflux system outer membrane protein